MLGGKRRDTFHAIEEELKVEFQFQKPQIVRIFTFSGTLRYFRNFEIPLLTTIKLHEIVSTFISTLSHRFTQKWAEKTETLLLPFINI